MELKNCNILWIKNKQLHNNLVDFFENLIQKKGGDIVAILLFGSLAKNEGNFINDYQSDIDLLIIANNLPNEIVERKLYTAKLSKSLGSGIDQIWHTPHEIEKLVNSHRAFYFEIIRDGKILFELNHILSDLKESIKKIIKEKKIKESNIAWIWPFKRPSTEIEW